MSAWKLHHGDCREVMASMQEHAVDAIVCDPPYGLGFMGKGWDHGVPGVEFWTAALRVAKPGAHLVAFGGTRTFHRLACAIEDAGWELRDTLGWLYGSGFPKSLNVSKAIDKAAGAERAVVGRKTGRAATPTRDLRNNGYHGGSDNPNTVDVSAITAPATEAARAWVGWGTTLKPAWEPILLARKPLDATVAQNVCEHGVGALHIDACRVLVEGEDRAPVTGKGAVPARQVNGAERQPGVVTQPNPLGRWPANIVHDGSAEVLATFPDAPGQQADASPHAPSPKTSNVYGAMKRSSAEASRNDANEGGTGFKMRPGARRLDRGSAGRFFYCAKASNDDRGHEEWDELPLFGEPAAKMRNPHPTVKPVELMRWLVRLVTPPKGLVLDPFMGSGSTGVATRLEGFRFEGIELESEYLQIAERRIRGAGRAA